MTQATPQPPTSTNDAPIALAAQPWYRTAVIYEVHVRAFCDSNADGIGDFKGLTSKLEYLSSLGVTALWILPFYPSPLRDDGYDIADYTKVNPSYGTIDDFREFVDKAHDLGLKVITELVINHTSDQHAWFQAARNAPPGSPERDFYVWSDDNSKYADTRIIFKDFEKSNWTWDEQAKAYYWHRFYHHQPDLNFDNPAVHDAVFKVMDEWFNMGVDGMRLDAIPYLYEREGTNCENLPETHVFLKKLRAHVDANHKDKMLLAEANQWPEDAASYFGDADECHMNFNFPIMPRLFMALRMEDRFPIIDIIDQTPEPPGDSQWALFLRNHDELTLEMVTDEERDYMYRSYAADPKARINLGIRRRLAPLLENNRRKFELLHGLLFSLPGTPVMYYGDEIAMGDNYNLGDRDAVRTPMQWNSSPNAGFSTADPNKLFLPVIETPQYHYSTVNVEDQQKTPSSILWWMRRTLALRQRHPVFGTGAMRILRCSNPKVFSYLREDDNETVLVLANLSRFTHAAEVDLSEYKGARVIEMFGRAEFPPVHNGLETYTLGPHSFMWLQIVPPDTDQASDVTNERVIPEIVAEDDPTVWLTTMAARRWFTEHLTNHPERQPWLAHQVRAVREIEVIDSLPIPLLEDSPSSAAALMIVRVRFSGSEFATFATAIAITTPDHFNAIAGEANDTLATVRHRTRREHAVLHNALLDPDIARGIYAIIQEQRTLRGYAGSLRGETLDGAEDHDTLPAPKELPEPRPDTRDALAASAWSFGDRYAVKLTSRDRPASPATLEIARHLDPRHNQHPAAATTPRIHGALYYDDQDRRALPVAVLASYDGHESTVRDLLADGLRRFIDDILTRESLLQHGPPKRPVRPLIELNTLVAPDSPLGAEFAQQIDTAKLLGVRLAEIHDALADPLGDESFQPERLGTLTLRSLHQAIRNTLVPALRALDDARPTLDDTAIRRATQLLNREADLLAQVKRITELPTESLRIRCFGQLQLDHILWTGRDFIFTEFESDPRRRLAEARLKHSPLRDLASLLTDITRTAAEVTRHQAVAGALPAASATIDQLPPWADHWADALSTALLTAYREHAHTLRPDLLPHRPYALATLFHAEMIERTAWNLHMALIRRPHDAHDAIEQLLHLAHTPASPAPGDHDTHANHPSAG